MTEHRVAETSINAYKKKVNDGTIGSQCQLVFDTLRMCEEDKTINELAELTGLPKGTVSGRLNNLKDDHGLVMDLSGDAKRKDKHTNIKSKVWTTTTSEEKEWVSDVGSVELIDTSKDLGLFEDDEQGDSSAAVLDNGDGDENAEEEKADSAEPSKPKVLMMDGEVQV